MKANFVCAKNSTPHDFLWWAKCSPSYITQQEGVVNCTSRTDWSYYLSSDDVLQYKNAGRLVAGFPLSYDPGNTTQQVIRPGKNAGDAERTFSLVTLGRDKDTLKKGDRVWVVSDGDSLTRVTVAASGNEPVFNDVYVPSAPVPVSAGDSLGHMGFYQLPEENGKRSRYQVHIECLSTDDMEKFITNPGKVGEDAPVYLTWQKDALLSDKGDTGLTAGGRKTKAPGILALAKVPGVDAEGNPLTSNKDAAWYQIRPEGGWLPAASVKKVSQYALGELGFVTLNKAPESFDLIDGIKQPNNVVKGILEQLYKAAQDETRTTHALNKYNYKRLLELIDSNQDGYYQEQEYLQAVHNVSYRDRLYRVIAKHASEWYYGKDDPLWKTYLDTLTRDAPRTTHALNKYNYKRLLELIDSNQDGYYQEQEYLQAVHNVSYRDRLYRVIAKHASEWYYGKDDPLWKTYLDTLTRDAPLWKAYLEAFLDKMTWMKTVSEKGVVLGSEPWHMHPIVFLNSIKKGKSKITREMLRTIWSDPRNVSDSVLDVVAEEFSNKFEVCNINTKNRLYHFFSQIYQEVGPTFNLNEGFNYRPQVLINKFAYYRNHPQYAQTDGYIPGRQVANKQNIANRAYGGREGNDNIASGDGWRYRGRGMKQLTFKNNYRSFTNYHERVWGERVDFESTPDLLVETVYAARSALYFWDQNNLFSRADNGISRAVSDSITRIVNLYDNHYEDRHNNLIRFSQEGIFDEIF
nr:hypothetical protein [Klebsiella quasivariicola]